jgi:ABC-type transporter Mla MlaB component
MKKTEKKPARGKARAGAKPAANAKAATATPRQLALDASCTLREAAALQASLVAAASDADPLTLDGGAVQRIDTAGLQLLVALARHQAAAGHRLEWQAASSELLRCSDRLGLIDALGLTSLAAGGRPS